jgi:hypothetical protein
VVGVSLGAACVLTMQHSPPPSSVGLLRPSVKIALPRRSAYVLSGDARTLWKHGISGVKPPTRRGAGAAPEWNDAGVRRTLTLRTTKTFNVEALVAAHAACNDRADLADRGAVMGATAALAARIAAQRAHWPEQHDSATHGSGVSFSAPEIATAAAAARELPQALAHGPLHAPQAMRMPAADACFLAHAHPSVCALYSDTDAAADVCAAEAASGNGAAWRCRRCGHHRRRC